MGFSDMRDLRIFLLCLLLFARTIPNLEKKISQPFDNHTNLSRYKLNKSFLRGPSMRWFFTVVILLYSAATLFNRSLVVDLDLSILFSTSMAAWMSANIDMGLGLCFSLVIHPSSELLKVSRRYHGPQNFEAYSIIWSRRCTSVQ